MKTYTIQEKEPLPHGHEGVVQREGDLLAVLRNAHRVKHPLDEPLEDGHVEEALLLGADPSAAKEVSLPLLQNRPVLHHPDVVGLLRGVPRGVVLLKLGHEGLAEDVHAVLVVQGAPDGGVEHHLLGLLALDGLALGVAAPEALERRGPTEAAAVVREPAVRADVVGGRHELTAAGTAVC